MTQPRLQTVADGVIVCVRAAPGASRERIVGVHGEAVKIAVLAPPERGKANERVVAVLAAALGIAPRQLELASGPAARDKKILVRGLSADEIARRLEPHMRPREN